MNHIKNYLEENNTYGVDILFIVDKDNQYVHGRSEGEETEDELKMIFHNLDRMGLIKKYNRTTHISFVDGGGDDVPIIDLYFRHFDDDLDEDFTPVCQVTKEFLKELGF
jgi:hypothetical protein